MNANVVKETTFVLVGFMFLIMTSVAESASKRLKITEVTEEPLGLLVITVDGLQLNNVVYVILGGQGPLIVEAITPTSIEASLPIDIVPGDYLLTVINDEDGEQGRKAEYDLFYWSGRANRTTG